MMLLLMLLSSCLLLNAAMLSCDAESCSSS
jgi:hypothetical protein